MWRLYTSKHVLTAAHCTARHSIDSLEVIVGESKRYRLFRIIEHPYLFSSAFEQRIPIQIINHYKDAWRYKTIIPKYIVPDKQYLTQSVFFVQQDIEFLRALAIV